VDLAHEALLRDDREGKPYWPTLRGWVDTEREQLQSRQVVERLAESWGKGRGGLVSGRQLRAFRPLLTSCVALSEQAGQFLRESLRQARLRTAATATLGAIMLGILGAFGYWINKEEMGPAMGFYVLAGKAGWILLEPKMIPIHPGEEPYPASFEMGCVSGKGCDDAERPVHQVTFDKPFAIGRYEVTFEQYELFAKLTGRVVPYAEGWGKGRSPVINVDWEDARDYAKWLAEETGKGYRLPTEAEWEYAARAGTTTPFSTGACIDTDQANYNGDSAWEDCPETGVGRGKTVEVGSLPANAWDLHEVHGNVYEWVEDCWHENYDGAPSDGAAWLEADGGDCGQRVVRGGSWNDVPGFLRSALRLRLGADGRKDFLGFRLAQDL
jgi:formylglycine-generating enzyme required for sulfatase activity